MAKQNNRKIHTKVLTPYGAIRRMSEDLGISVDCISDALNAKTDYLVTQIVQNIACLHYGGAKIQI